MVVVNVFTTEAHPHTFEKCDKEFYIEDSLHGHVAGVHTAAQPNPNPRLASSVTKNVTERTVCRDMRPMFMLI